ncbi:hypothetical protein MMAD_17490 [Mycolicibacterium madagascariense]|uniref:non-specific serine/threonine protein kinase n=1 Tax=Mycolicibacterium madagascariense TaxID=212765 RepID=A0A7I7XCX0_9MYCO|nr:serine/threonine-protein kinase [Mycolicibacterium madagascariense]MCV7015161.1 serine/threonine protein kinase [Mycolicibacterium madagascariense]BBZ27454.1 hypothetical protein MMAD_17490 [Mycolicibacterium madagascariense]
MPLTPGSVFAGYTVQALLGSGGMGEVYLVRHPRLPRRDALKVLPLSFAEDVEYRRRFDREADAAAGLWHPNIVGVHDRGEFDGQLWISMDYVEGSDASQLLRDQYVSGLPLTEAVAVVTATADALDYAHAQGLMHRDVKPANILLTSPRSGKRRVLLTDFGIARRLDDTRGLTATNMTLGTLHYAAPEQLLGDSIDGRADQYALAATAFHLVAGRAPDATSNPAALINRRLHSSAPRLTDVRSDLVDLDAVLARGMARDPAERFRTCEEFAKALADSCNAAVARQSAFHTAFPPTHTAQPEKSRMASTPYEPRPAPPESVSNASDGRRSLIVPALIALGVVLTIGLVLVSLLLILGRPQQSATTSPTAVAPDTSPTASASPSTVTVTSSFNVETPSANVLPPLPADVDAHGFTTFGGGARCLDSDDSELFVRTAQSALVVCRSETNQLYYRGYRLSDGAGIELDTVYPQGNGFVALNSPENAQYEISSTGLQIIQNGNVISSEPAIESGL